MSKPSYGLPLRMIETSAHAFTGKLVLEPGEDGMIGRTCADETVLAQAELLYAEAFGKRRRHCYGGLS